MDFMQSKHRLSDDSFYDSTGCPYIYKLISSNASAWAGVLFSLYPGLQL
jgi:hypothetical protein